ncbi:hypothetical protein [Saccharothrix obliqua]|uniref:hypothetical protein n=1 Tax=Saccharothrix obliqua TaxID=2861747 RepID=UPI001C5EA60D|nr:hypothetical protein [Saccharothrix obliqua]MBW4715578.1 hypothetical protein [Saccharothrix obliqua]
MTALVGLAGLVVGVLGLFPKAEPGHVASGDPGPVPAPPVAVVGTAHRAVPSERSAPTTTPAVEAPTGVAPPVRYRGTLPFGDYDLDQPQPRYAQGRNVWRVDRTTLHGDAGYELAVSSAAAPGRAECAALARTRGESDVTGLAPGRRVCGTTPAGRVFRVDVIAVTGESTYGAVTVWESVGIT